MVRSHPPNKSPTGKAPTRKSQNGEGNGPAPTAFMGFRSPTSTRSAVTKSKKIGLLPPFEDNKPVNFRHVRWESYEQSATKEESPGKNSTTQPSLVVTQSAVTGPLLSGHSPSNQLLSDLGSIELSNTSPSHDRKRAPRRKQATNNPSTPPNQTSGNPPSQPPGGGSGPPDGSGSGSSQGSEEMLTESTSSGSSEEQEIMDITLEEEDLAPNVETPTTVEISPPTGSSEEDEIMDITLEEEDLVIDAKTPTTVEISPPTGTSTTETSSSSNQSSNRENHTPSQNPPSQPPNNSPPRPPRRSPSSYRDRRALQPLPLALYTPSTSPSSTNSDPNPNPNPVLPDIVIYQDPSARTHSSHISSRTLSSQGTPTPNRRRRPPVSSSSSQTPTPTPTPTPPPPPPPVFPVRQTRSRAAATGAMLLELNQRQEPTTQRQATNERLARGPLLSPRTLRNQVVEEVERRDVAPVVRATARALRAPRGVGTGRGAARTGRGAARTGRGRGRGRGALAATAAARVAATPTNTARARNPRRLSRTHGRPTRSAAITAPST